MVTPLRHLSILLVLVTVSSCLKRNQTNSETAAGKSQHNSLQETPVVSCAKNRSAESFVTAVIQDLAARTPTVDEINLAKDPSFSPEAFVDRALDSPLFDDGVTRFISNLLRLNNLSKFETVRNNEPLTKALGDLKQEAITLVLRNREKPWGYVFEAEDFYCTENTAPLYDFPLKESPGFVSCKLPKERGGILSLLSFLLSTSTPDKPQAFYLGNNNYHRVAVAVYIATGIELLANTNGPKGEGRGIPMAPCAPADDMRTDKGGLIFGTAAVPLAGPVCATCHSTHMGPVSVAFRRFGTLGEVLKLEEFGRLVNDPNNITSLGDLKAILANQRSCWAPEPELPPSEFNGLAGFGKLIAHSAPLGRALGRQLPRHLSNRDSDDETVNAVYRSYESGGKTLKSAFRGYFLSKNFRCE